MTDSTARPGGLRMRQTHDNLLVGTRGWDHASWQGGFYPDELPPDWRLGFYATQLRCVLVPGDTWAAGTGPAWMADTGDSFRFLLEVDPGAWPDPAAFLEASAALAARTAALLLRAPADPGQLQAWLSALGPRAPVCADGAPAAARALCKAAGASLCWHPAGGGAAPDADGEFLVALAPPADLRTARGWLERMGEWAGRDRGVALIVEDGALAPVFAQQVRLAAELLGL